MFFRYSVIMKIQEGIQGYAYEAGYKILKAKGTALVPLCPANGYFKRQTTDELLRTAAENFSAVAIFIPDKPTEHTYRAIGYGINESERKARLQGNKLRNHAHRSIAAINQDCAVFYILDWAANIENRKEYLSELDRQKSLSNQKQKK